MPEMNVRLRPKSVFGMIRNPRSASPEISVRFRPKYTTTDMISICHQIKAASESALATAPAERVRRRRGC